MKNISSKYIYVCAVAAAMLTSSCVDFLNKDFLDKTPDNRTELKTPSQIAEFLVNAYPDCNISTLAELSGDNFIDNNTPNPENPTEVYNLGSYDRSNDEAFAWEDVVSNSA